MLLLEVGHPFYLRLQPNPPLGTASFGSSVGPLTRMSPPLKPEMERGLPLGMFCGLNPPRGLFPSPSYSLVLLLEVGHSLDLRR